MNIFSRWFSRASWQWLISVALVCFCSTAGASAGVMTRFKDPRPIVIAHRGCWNVTSENSISGLNACIERGIDMVEIDIWATKDGKLVLMHDDTIDRMTDRTGRIADLSQAEIKAAHLRQGAGGKDAAITQESPPTFEEFLRAAKGKAILYLDSRVDYATLVPVIEREGAQDWVVLPADLEMYKKLPQWAQRHSMLVAAECGTVGAGCFPSLDQAIQTFHTIRPLSIAVLFKTDSYVTEGLDAVKALGTRLCVWSVSAPQWDGGRVEADSAPGPHEVWSQLQKLGFDVIETNDAPSLAEYLRSQAGGGSPRVSATGKGS